MEKFKIKNSLGMFDLLRGITMIFMVFVHTYSMFPDTILYEHTYARVPMNNLFIPIRLLITIYGLFVGPLMPAFFVMSGYGYRKLPMKKTIEQQARMLFIPYIVTSLLAVCLHLCTHYSLYRYLKGSVLESVRLLGGFLLGLPCTAYYGDLKIFSCGPIWYLLALMWAWCIFNLIMSVCKEKNVLPAVIGISLVGWLIGLGNTVPFCISQGLIAVLYIYIGYYLKSTKTFVKGISGNKWIVYFLLVLVPNCIIHYLGIMDGMADSVYPLGFFSIVEDGLMGIFIIFCFLQLNRFSGRISGMIRFIGRNSMMFLCVHTFEMMGFPWYYFANSWTKSPALGCIIIYIVRFCVDVLLCMLLIFTKKRMNRWEIK